MIRCLLVGICVHVYIFSVSVYMKYVYIDVCVACYLCCMSVMNVASYWANYEVGCVLPVKYYQEVFLVAQTECFSYTVHGCDDGKHFESNVEEDLCCSYEGRLKIYLTLIYGNELKPSFSCIKNFPFISVFWICHILSLRVIGTKNWGWFKCKV